MNKDQAVQRLNVALDAHRTARLNSRDATRARERAYGAVDIAGDLAAVAYDAEAVAHALEKEAAHAVVMAEKILAAQAKADAAVVRRAHNQRSTYYCG